jgi:hypothetical protein
MTGAEGFFFGLIGGVALEFLEVVRVSRMPKRDRKRHTEDRLWWSVRGGSALLGAAFGMAYTVSATNPVEFVALTMGAAWPTVVGRIWTDGGPQVVTKTN